MQLKGEGNNRPKAGRAALILGLALGAALLFSAPQAALAQRGGPDHRPQGAPYEAQKNKPKKPPQDNRDKDRGGNFNKWDKGWKNQDGHRPPQAKPGQGGQKPPQAKPGQGGQKPPQAKPGQGGHRPPQVKPGQGGHRPPQAKPGQGGHRPPQVKPGQPGWGGGSDFKRFDPGIDRKRARDMARGHKMSGYKPLPDSVRRSMHIGRPLPPKAYPRPVPDYMRRRLPHHPGYEWRVTGRDLVLVAVGSLIIYEIFDNVFSD